MMVIALFASLFLLANNSQQSSALFFTFSEATGPGAMAAVQAILSTKQQQECPVLLLFNNPSRITLPFLKAVGTAQALQGVTVFQVEDYNLNANASLIQLRSTVDKIHQLGGMWHCLVVVVVSDDPAFLDAFTHLSLRRHALRWSTRILVFTRLSLSHLGGLHVLLSNRNAMLLLAHRNKKVIRGVDVYVSSPYSLPSARLRKVDTWTPNNTWAHSTHLFPEKFLVFSSAPTLTIGIELLPQHKLSWEEDPHAPDGRRLVYTGTLDKTVQYFAKGMNFTYRYVLSLDRTFGRKLPNGSWTGLMGMIVREETDFGLGPFSLSPVRVEAADHTIPMWTGNMKMVSGLTGLKVDPWGFLLPLRSLVWTTTLTALLGVLAALQIFSSCLSNGMFCQNSWSANIFSPVRVLLQQDVVWPKQWWWWERLVLGLWMLIMLVLTKSYAGNLMSLLAVRYVPQPFQTIQDVLDHPSVVMIWEKHSRGEQFLRDVESGMFKEVAELEQKGRLEFHTQSQFLASLSTLVRIGRHVLVIGDITIRSLVALYVSHTGSCDFYLSKDGFFPYSAAVMSQKTNPIIRGLNPRMMALLDSGLLQYWAQDVPNFTRCSNIPKRVMLFTTLSTINLWGMFVVLGAGLAVGSVVWCAELLASPSTPHSHHHLAA